MKAFGSKEEKADEEEENLWPSAKNGNILNTYLHNIKHLFHMQIIVSLSSFCISFQSSLQLLGASGKRPANSPEILQERWIQRESSLSESEKLTSYPVSEWLGYSQSAKDVERRKNTWYVGENKL